MLRSRRSARRHEYRVLTSTQKPINYFPRLREQHRAEVREEEENCERFDVRLEDVERLANEDHDYPSARFAKAELALEFR